MNDVEDLNASRKDDQLAFRIAVMQSDFNRIIKLIDNVDLSDGDCLDEIEMICKKYRD